jgi:hypothetical protein
MGKLLTGMFSDCLLLRFKKLSKSSSSALPIAQGDKRITKFPQYFSNRYQSNQPPENHMWIVSIFNSDAIPKSQMIFGRHC